MPEGDQVALAERQGGMTPVWRKSAGVVGFSGGPVQTEFKGHNKNLAFMPFHLLPEEPSSQISQPGSKSIKWSICQQYNLRNSLF